MRALLAVLLFSPLGMGSSATPEPDAATLFAEGAALEAQGKGSEAIRIYEQAGRKGSVSALKRLGEIYERGIRGVPRDHAESTKWCTAACTFCAGAEIRNQPTLLKDCGEIVSDPDFHHIREEQGRGCAFDRKRAVCRVMPRRKQPVRPVADLD